MATGRAAATIGHCPRCRAPIYGPTLVGHRAALEVTADAHPLPLDQALAHTGPNRLAWCLIQRAGGGHRLAPYHPSAHPTGCLSHVLDHRCPRPPPAHTTADSPQQPHLF